MDADSKVQLARMEGKLDLVNDRHESMKADISDVRQRLHGHATRITVLETDKHVRTGAMGTIKWIWGGGIVTACAVIGLTLKVFGVVS